MNAEQTLIPVAFNIPSGLVEMATNAPFNKSTTASKIRLLLNHFFENKLSPIDMSNYEHLKNDHNFTLRLLGSELESLDTYCKQTLYTRQQALQIAICTALSDLENL